MFPYPYDTEMVAIRHRDLREDVEHRRLAGESRPRRGRRRHLRTRARR